jgi:hypothetical protein
MSSLQANEAGKVIRLRSIEVEKRGGNPSYYETTFVPHCLDLGVIRNRLCVLATAYAGKYGSSYHAPHRYREMAEDAIRAMARPVSAEVSSDGQVRIVTRDAESTYEYCFSIDLDWFKRG